MIINKENKYSEVLDKIGIIDDNRKIWFENYMNIHIENESITYTELFNKDYVNDTINIQMIPCSLEVPKINWFNKN